MKSARNTRSRYLRKTTDYYLNKYAKNSLNRRNISSKAGKTPKSKQIDDDYEEPRDPSITPSELNTPIATSNAK